MLFARSMTGFTTLPFRPLMSRQSRFPVRPSLETLSLLLMARLAGIRAYILRRVRMIGISVPGLAPWAIFLVLLLAGGFLVRFFGLGAPAGVLLLGNSNSKKDQ